MTKKQKKSFWQIIISAVLLIVCILLPVTGIPRLLCFLFVYLFIGFGILKKAFLGVFRGSIFDENFLMAVATVGAFVLAVYTKSGDYTEGIAVMLFYRVGELFESVAVGKSRKSIAALMDIRPDYANLVTQNGIQKVSPEQVEVGQTIAVNSGEKIPLDGIIGEGTSSLDTSALTGESVPRYVTVGDEVFSGCINQSGVLYITVTKPFGQSTVSKILELVENAASKKAKSEAFISRFSAYYTPAVCGIALLLGVIPPLFSGNFDIWLYRALTFLVVSCPCALVISIPLTFFAGIGGASKAGVLVKGANYIETLAKTDTVIFDKTGTLTEGNFAVTQINAYGMDKDTLLEYAALAESASSHPIAQSLKKAYSGQKSRSVRDITEISGLGVCAFVDGKRIACGSTRLMEKEGAVCADPKRGGTAVYVSVDGVYAGSIVFADKIKKDSASAITGLKKLGISKTVMLTGDREDVASDVARQIGIDDYRHSLLPDQKVLITEQIMAEASGKVVFAGDGINDAPVLTRADVGIAMGGIGSDSAIEAADVVIMQDSPAQIVKAIKISRKVMRIVYENIIFSLFVKFACLALAALGMANMWLAVFADVGVMVLAVINAVRALNTRDV